MRRARKQCCSHKTGHVLSFQGRHKYQLLPPFNSFSPESLPFSTNTDSFSFQNIFLYLSLQPNTSFPFLKENCDDALKSEDSGDRSSNPRVCRNLTISVVASSPLSNPSLCFNGSSLSLSGLQIAHTNIESTPFVTIVRLQLDINLFLVLAILTTACIFSSSTHPPPPLLSKRASHTFFHHSKVCSAKHMMDCCFLFALFWPYQPKQKQWSIELSRFLNWLN